MLGFRPYRDIIYLDAAFLTAFRENDCADALPLNTSRIPIVAIDAAAFAVNDDGTLTAVLDAFPALQRILLVVPAVVDRPAPAACDLGTEVCTVDAAFGGAASRV